MIKVAFSKLDIFDAKLANLEGLPLNARNALKFVTF